MEKRKANKMFDNKVLQEGNNLHSWKDTSPGIKVRTS